MNSPEWRPQAPAITFPELAETLARRPVVVIQFWAIWNAYDRPMDARLQPLHAELAERIAFYSYDVDDPSSAGREFLHHCQVLNVPALGCFIHGEHRETLIGLRDPAMLRQKLEEWTRWWWVDPV